MKLESFRPADSIEHFEFLKTFLRKTGNFQRSNMVPECFPIELWKKVWLVIMPLSV